jgi:hypothetical protein
MMRSVILAALALVPACRTGEQAQAPWHQEQGYRWRELRVAGGTPGFTAIAPSRSGIQADNTVPDSVLLGNRILAQGAGVCLGDVDEDGRVDVFLARTVRPNTLYRNLGDWRFADITDSAGVAAPGRHSTGCAFADVDGDGHLDLVLLATTGPNAVFLGNGAGRFTERRDLGLDPGGKGGTTLALADVDGDGALDLFVGNYKPYTPVDRYSATQRAFGNITRQTGPDRYEVNPEYRDDFKLVQRPDVGLALSMRAEPDEFYRNDGTGHFQRERLTAGRFRDALGRPIVEEPESFTLAVRFADLNGDGAPDLYVVNDFEDPDQLWINDGKGRFRLAGWTAQRQTSNSAMGIDVADVDGDGTPDFFLTDMLADGRRRKTEVPTHTVVPKRPGQMELQLQQMRNTLFLNRGDGTFAELAAFAGLSATGWSWGTLFVDVDLDGRPDLLVANGHPWDIMDGDVQERQQQGWSTVPWERRLTEFPRLALRNLAFRNRGDSTFENVSRAWGIGTEADISHAIAAADLDGDGDQDLVITRLDAPPLVLRNDAPAPRIAVRLIGIPPNTRAVGARIRVRAGGLPPQEREVTAGGLYLSHSDYLATFATGAAKAVTVEVDWRDGTRTVLENLLPNRMYEVRQPGSPAVGGSEIRADLPRFRPAEVPTLFEDVTPMLAGHQHVENPFDDWGRQYLLPDALSTLGPGVAWFDVDRSGSESLIIGSGKGGRLALFQNRGGRLVPVPGGPVAAEDLTTVLGLAGPGGSRLLAGIASWEGRSEEELDRIPSVGVASLTGNAAPGALDALLGPAAGSIGPLALGDYTGDGALDLFVGARAIPLGYPAAPSSALFRNVGGRFVPDSDNTRLLEGIGMVSAAMFADLNGDGLPDLVLAREWGSIAVFVNAGQGRFAPAPPSLGLARWTSRWNGIAAGDLDGDGRLDLVATSWGRNTAVSADSANPLFLAHGPFGARGEEEMLLARYDPELGRIAPIGDYSRIRLAVPSIAGRFPSFAAWAGASLDQVLGAVPSRTSRLAATTLDHMVFLNRGDHFEAHPLPGESQLAPAFYAGIADFDGDGQEDLFLGQNWSYTVVGTPRYDAGRGLLLLGDGHGGLRPMRGDASGLVIYGDQRGAGYADYDRDGRLDLAVSQNGGPTLLFHNRGARPGLRVRIAGPPANPDGVGCQVRLVFGDRMGPVREVQAGSGYWSQNGAVQVLGLSGTPTAVWSRCPGEAERRTPIVPGAGEVLVRP